MQNDKTYDKHTLYTVMMAVQEPASGASNLLIGLSVHYYYYHYYLTILTYYMVLRA